ncbi:hypothetical protein WMF31_36580 [Sorangium sp. So ce1036]|uniref:hypothetical protein n=1 Tax=Sorangium sp. So ce1036 TaxID=3133328 RepID=UPI003F10058D
MKTDDSAPGVCVKHTVLILGGSESSIMGAHFHPGGSWTTATLSGASTSAPPALTLNLSEGIGLVRDGSNRLRYTRWSYETEIWSTFAAPLGTGNELTATVAPALSSFGTRTSAAYFDKVEGTPDPLDRYFYLHFEEGSWSAMPELVASLESPSNSRPSIALPSATGNPWMALRIEGAMNPVQVRRRTDMGSWEEHTETPYRTDTGALWSFAMVATSDEELYVVMVTLGGDILWTKRNGSMSWSDPELLATEGGDIALAALPGGKVVLAYRAKVDDAGDVDGQLFTSFYDGATWSTPAALAFGGTPVRIAGAPAITRGVGERSGHGAFVELAYVRYRGTNQDGMDFGQIEHTRCTAIDASDCTSWTPPLSVGNGTNFTSVAIASMP